MVRYFCDRCGVEVTRVGGSNPLHSSPDRYYGEKGICDACNKKWEEFHEEILNEYKAKIEKFMKGWDDL